MNSLPNFEVITRVQGIETAEIIKGRLESEGIPVYMQYESAGKIYGIICDGIGEVRLLVPEEYSKEAKHILNEINIVPEAEQD
ncbi:MAG: DUF2007 domain-containing protein [Dehalococcoidales bacterium]